jgi:hypothetical protein
MVLPFRQRLRFGPYRTPRFNYGQKVECLARGELRITKLSSGRIPWPMGLGAGGKPTVALYRDLAKAVRRESNAAICYWWGVGPSTVGTWRKALGVQAPNEGDRRVLADHGRSPKGRKAVLAMHATARDPGRRAKIAAAKLGKRRPPHVAKLLRTMNLGRKHTTAFRKWLSEHHKRNESGRRGSTSPGSRGKTSCSGQCRWPK